MNELVGYKLSPQQRQILSLKKHYSDQCEKITFSIGGAINQDWLFNSIRDVVDRHSIFSTTYYESENMDVQIINEKPLTAFCDTRLKNFQAGDPLHGDALPFIDLKNGPLLKVTSCIGSEGVTKVEMEVASVCLDEWSVVELVKQIGEAYHGGSGDASPQEILQYIQFSEWQNQMLTDGDSVFDKLYWRKLTLPNAATLSFDTAGNHVLCTDRHLAIDMQRAKHGKLAQMIAAGFVLEDILRTCWYVLIWKLSQNSDTVIENQHPVRDFEELHSSIGPFSKYLPLFVPISSSQKFSDTLRALSRVVADNEKHKYTYPDHSEAEQEPAGVRYPYGFCFLSHSFAAPEATWSASSSDYTLSAPHHLQLSCIDSADSLIAKIKYSSRAFDQDHIQFIADAFATIVDQVSENPGIEIDAIRLHDQQRELEFIGKVNSTRNYALGENVFHAFQKQVETHPDRLAVVAPGKQITYAELAVKVGEVATELWNVNVQPGDLVGVLCGQDENIAIAFLAALKVGAAFLPLDPANPDSRIDFIINDSKLKTVITTTKFANKVTGIDHVICIDTIDGTAFTGARPAHISRLQDVAYTIYTSGSTGKPKGAQVSHGALLNYVAWLKGTYSISGNDNGVLLSSYAFDLGYTVIWGTLLSGACLHVLPLELVKKPDALIDYLNSQKITLLKLTPSLFYVVVNAVNVTRLRDSSLRLILLGGEKISCEDVALMNQVKPGITFVNHYGPTETTIGTIAKTINVRQLEDYAREPVIGKAISNNSVFIVDANNRVVPPYVVGEICISGAGVSNGYINRDDLNREKFVLNPYLPGQVMYKTGDLAYWTLDGDVLLKGRIDDQVKVRGYRVELDEVSTIFARSRGVNQAAVLARPSREGSNELCAYVVAAPDFVYDDLKDHLKQNLPEYMIPAHIMMVDAIPLTRNGKIDRQALLHVETRDLAPGSEYLPPRTPLEKSLAVLFEEVLKKNKVGLRDDFFDIGGNSLKAIQLVSRIQKILHHKVDLKVIFTESTVQKLAEHISQAATEQYSEIQAVPKQSYYPVSFGQRRLWILSQQDGLSGVYNVPSCYRIKGSLEVAALVKAFDDVVSRHESLRTTFSLVDGKVVQKINSFERAGFSTKFVNFSESIEKEKSLKNLVEQHALEVFDLANGPLINVLLIREMTDSYVLCINVHHIVSDEWSRAVLLKEVLSLYKTNQANVKSELSPLRIHYKDFACWQSEELAINRITSHRDYWLGQLSGELPVLNLPTDFTRPPIKSNRGENVSISIGDELSRQLYRVSQERGVSLFMIFATTLKVLFYKYTGQRDMIIGMPVTGRKNSELEEQIGFYVNTLAIRSQISEDDSFADFLLRERENTLQAYEHDVYPFDLLLEDLKPGRDLSRSPLFDVLILFRSASLFSGDGYAVAGLEFDTYALDIPHSKFDLTFNFNEDTDGLNLFVEFCSDLYTKSTVQRMLQHYLQLLSRVLGNLQCKLQDVEYIPDDERDELLNKFNATDQSFPESKTIVDLFEEQCEKTADAIAVVSGTEQLTYAELNDRANLLASYLIESFNVNADDLIGVMMDRSIDQVVGVLGILKAGAAYVPIDKKYPESRVDRILNGAGLKTVLLDSDADKSFFLKKGYNYVVKEQYDYLSKGEKYGNPVKRAGASNLAYVIHTSGSTGIPKGVMVENRSVVRLVRNTNFYNFKFGDKLLQTVSLAFDLSTLELWGPLLNGGEVHLISTEELLNERYLKKYISEQNIDVMWFTSSWFNQLVNSDTTIFRGLSTILVGGEKVSKAHVQKLKSANEDITIINGYGPTENTTFSTCHQIDHIGAGDIPIGKPISNSTAYILDKHNNLVGKGIYGEICVGGVGLSRGYFRDEALTRAKFIPHPFESGKFIYKTGDIGRWAADGNIEYHGRADRQLKLRGYRIEISEIEYALLHYPGIRNAFVSFRAYSGLGNQLVAYIITHAEVRVSDLRKQLKKDLAEYMIPRYFVFLEEFPLTTNGKIDERALPEPELNDAAAEVNVPPRNNLERSVAAVWEQVLERRDISIDANFFDLGGHSLKASQMITKLYRELNYRLELRDVFTNPTIQELSQLIEARKQVSFNAIARVPVANDYALSHAQKRLWIVDQLQSGKAVYNINNAYRVHGALNRAALHKSLSALVERHEVLRTSFAVIDGEVRQKINESTGFTMQYEDLRGEAKNPEQIDELLIEEESKAFDISESPLMRARLIHVADDDYVFMLTLHHIISDGWSVDILFKGLVDLYESFGKNVEPAKEPLPIQYKDYSQWHNDLLKGTQGNEHKAYWLERFSGQVPVLDLPTDYNRPKVKTFGGNNVRVEVDKDTANALLRIGIENNHSLFIVLLAAVKALFFKYSGQDDITLGTVVAGRDHIDLEDQLGYYVNNLALRTRFSGEHTLKQLINQVAETVLEGFEHQLYPFDLLVDDLAIPVGSGQRSPLFDIIVSFHSFERGHGNIENLVIDKLSKRTASCKYDMVITFVNAHEGITANIEYSTDLFSEATINQLAKNMLLVLQHISDAMNDKLHDLPIEVGMVDVNRKSFEKNFNFDFNL